MKKILFSVVVAAMLWSCGKDDGPSTPPASTAPTITDFNPKTGPVGTEVTITGTNFSTTKTDNVVKVRNTVATVSSATATQLKVTVPAGAQTGKITVAVDGETAATATDFTVTLLVAENSAPEFGEMDPISAKEDITVADQIAQLGASDADGDDLTFMLDEDESGLFAVSEEGVLTLAEGKTLDYETATSHSITVSVTDGKETVDATITITVENVIDTLAEDPASFVTKWETTDPGESIYIGANTDYEYNFTINWGDGTEENIDTVPENGIFEHAYADAGVYKVSIIGEFPAIKAYTVFNGLAYNKSELLKLVGLERWGSVKWKSLESAFLFCSNMVYNATDVPDLSMVTDISHMFSYIDSFDGDLSGWDTSNVTNMSWMFYKNTSFNGDISDWDTANVTNMDSMFGAATSFNADISDWDTASVTNMRSMFSGATSFNTDISGWDTAKVTDMSSMFEEAVVFDQNLADWDISNVSTMNNMLNNTAMSTTNYESTLAGWYVKDPDEAQVPGGVPLDAAGVTYCFEAIKNALINQYGWGINDGGLDPNCP